MKVLLRPLCWLVGHLWEMGGASESDIQPYWFCDRCGFGPLTKAPKGWFV